MATRTKERTTVELPAPTVHPMLLGLGMTFIFAGIVTHWLVTVTGAALSLIGIVGWFRDLFPEQRLEIIEVELEAPKAPPAAPPLEPGRDRHRARLPVAIHPYSSGLRGGLLGAVSMAVVACVYGLVAQGSLWYPVNLLAAMTMPRLTEAGVEELKSFHLLAFVTAVGIHAAASAIMGLLYAVILPMLPHRPMLLGGIIAPAIWMAVLFPTMRLVNPALDEHVSWLWFAVSQFAFGLTVGWSIARTSRIETFQLVPLADRVGLESSKGRRT